MSLYSKQFEQSGNALRNAMVTRGENRARLHTKMQDAADKALRDAKHAAWEAKNDPFSMAAALIPGGAALLGGGIGAIAGASKGGIGAGPGYQIGASAGGSLGQAASGVMNQLSSKDPVASAPQQQTTMQANQASSPASMPPVGGGYSSPATPATPMEGNRTYGQRKGLSGKTGEAQMTTSATTSATGGAQKEGGPDYEKIAALVPALARDAGSLIGGILSQQSSGPSNFELEELARLEKELREKEYQQQRADSFDRALAMVR